jgi:hypothetical protein
MPLESIQTIAGYIALAVPVTVAIANLARIGLEWLRQRHTIQSAQVQQSHQITTHYLDRALDPTVPLAIRHQLLRFLATPDTSGSRLSTWAEGELKRVGGIVEETNRAVATAQSEVQSAKTAAEIANAERKLSEAVQRQKSLLEAPVVPPVTAAALRAGLIETKQLNGLYMKGQDLSRAKIQYRELRGADFTEADLSYTNFQGSDLRTATFAGANLANTFFYAADLRGADLSNAQIDRTTFQKARLEGADLRAKSLEMSDLRATFDQSTRWPDGFDPAKAGAVLVSSSTE